MLKMIKTTTLSLICTLLMSSQAFAEGEAHGSGGGGLPQFDPTSWPSQLFWLAVFFTLLYMIFGKSVIPSLGETIETRASYIADHIQKAEALSAEAEILKNEVNAAYKAASHTAARHISETETTAKAALSGALTEFRSHYDQKVIDTEEKITAAKKTAMADMEKIVVALATQAAEKIAGIPASESGAEDVVKLLSQSRKVA